MKIFSNSMSHQIDNNSKSTLIGIGLDRYSYIPHMISRTGR